MAYNQIQLNFVSHSSFKIYSVDDILSFPLDEIQSGFINVMLTFR